MPSVDQGDLTMLIIRFVAANFLIFSTGFCLLKHYFVFAAMLAVPATLTQRAAIILFRSMREEYATALETRGGDSPVSEATAHAS